MLKKCARASKRSDSSKINSCTRRKPLVITIDGPSGAGKSTAAKLLAKELRLAYLDTGATYRALAYLALSKKINLQDEVRLNQLASSISLEFRQSQSKGPRVILSGHDITEKIRCERVTEAAACVAQYPRIRALLVRLQRGLIIRNRGCVLEGRDTGTVVFPRANIKFFLSASIKVRARRRINELKHICHESPSMAYVTKQLKIREHLDRSRKVGPLVCPDGSISIDTSRLNESQVVNRLLKYISDNGHALGKKPLCNNGLTHSSCVS
jgi:CMP/dCMP kinase